MASCCTGDYAGWMEDAEGADAGPVDVTLTPVAVNVWTARSHPKENASCEEGDDWLACCTLRAERYVRDEEVTCLHEGSPGTTRRYAHLFAVRGRFPLSAHRVLERKLLGMGFTHRYQERALGGGQFRVRVTNMLTRKSEVRIMSSSDGPCDAPCGEAPRDPALAGPAAAALLGLDWEKVKEGARRLLPAAKLVASLTANTYDDAFVAFVEALLAGQP